MNSKIIKRISIPIFIMGISILRVAALESNNQVISTFNSLVREPESYSPQVMEMMRYDNHTRVNINTGSINQTISLVNFQDKDFDCPISISYTSSGFRPRNADNYVGRDWRMNAGGVVYRKVNGIPDDLKGYKAQEDQTYAYTGFLDMLGKRRFNTDVMKNEVARNPYKYAKTKAFDSSMMTIPSAPDVECSPDIFYFSFGKHSDKFIINYDGTVSATGTDGGRYEVDLSGMKMFSSMNPQETYIRIKTDDGYVYTFGGSGYSSLEYNALSWNKSYNSTPNSKISMNAITAFHLTQIKAPNSRTLNIRYRDVESRYHSNPVQDLNTLNRPGAYEDKKAVLLQYLLNGSSTKVVPYGFPGVEGTTGKTYPKYTHADANQTYTLTKIALIDRIQTDNCTINFSYSQRDSSPVPVLDPNRLFYVRCGAKLDKVEMSYNGATESAQLDYSFELGNRMFLKTVKTTQEGTYQMKYNTPSMSEVPNPLTCNIDHWGFWRGENANVALVPGMEYPMPQFSLGYKITTNHRDATENRYDVSLLQKMTFPTNGTVEFTYEPHRYSRYISQNNPATFYPVDNYLSPSESGLAGGARIRSVLYSEAGGKKQKETVYTYGSQSREGRVMYMPCYRHLHVEKSLNGAEYVKIGGVAYSSEGFTDSPYPSVHIRYPEVTEHFIDPLKGGLEQKHAYTKREFFTAFDYTNTCYSQNEYFQTLSTEGNDNVYNLFPTEYLKQVKQLVAHPTDDASVYYSKLTKESYYDEDKNPQKTVEYQYQFLNKDEYDLCLYVPNYGSEWKFSLFTHIGKVYSRYLLPTTKLTTTYGTRDRQGKQQLEYYKYDRHAYPIEQGVQKSPTDTLVTTYIWRHDNTSHGFQVLPYIKQEYIVTPNGRKLLGSHEFSFKSVNGYAGKGTYWNVASKEYRFDADRKLVNAVDYTFYDVYGNMIETVENEVQHTVYLWSHYGQYLRARIENATYAEVKEALGQNPETLSFQSGTTPALDNLRSLLPNANVYTFQFAQGYNPTSFIGPNGKSQHYRYDSKGRLTETYQLNEAGKKEILQLNDYHIVNE